MWVVVGCIKVTEKIELTHVYDMLCPLGKLAQIISQMRPTEHKWVFQLKCMLIKKEIYNGIV